MNKFHRSFLLANLFILMIAFSANSVFAASRNLCDDIIELSKDVKAYEICIEKIGVSEYHKDQEYKKLQKIEIEAKEKKELEKLQALEEERIKLENEKNVRLNANIEQKSFSAEEIQTQTIYPVYAMKIKYDNRHIKEEKVITEADKLCKFLKFDKAISSTVSDEIGPHKANNHGMYVQEEHRLFAPNIFSLELFKEDPKDVSYSVRKYEKIVCARIINKEIIETEEILNLIRTTNYQINNNTDPIDLEKSITPFNDSKRSTEGLLPDKNPWSPNLPSKAKKK